MIGAAIMAMFSHEVHWKLDGDHYHQGRSHALTSQKPHPVRAAEAKGFAINRSPEK